MLLSLFFVGVLLCSPSLQLPVGSPPEGGSRPFSCVMRGEGDGTHWLCDQVDFQSAADVEFDVQHDQDSEEDDSDEEDDEDLYPPPPMVMPPMVPPIPVPPAPCFYPCGPPFPGYPPGLMYPVFPGSFPVPSRPQQLKKPQAQKGQKGERPPQIGKSPPGEDREEPKEPQKPSDGGSTGLQKVKVKLSEERTEGGKPVQVTLTKGGKVEGQHTLELSSKQSEESTQQQGEGFKDLEGKRIIEVSVTRGEN